LSRTIARTEKNKRFASAVPALLLSVVVFIMAIAGTATAAKLITGKDIKNGTVTTQDVKNGSLAEKDLKSKVKLNAAVAGYEVRQSPPRSRAMAKGLPSWPAPPARSPSEAAATGTTRSFDNTIQESSPQRVIGDFFAPAEPGFADGWKVTGKHNGLDPADLTAWVCVDRS